MPVMRPRMYGSTDQYLPCTSTCPSAGSGIGASTSEKSDSLGKPTGRAASLNCRVTEGKGPKCGADIGLYYLSDVRARTPDAVAPLARVRYPWNTGVWPRLLEGP